MHTPFTSHALRIAGAAVAALIAGTAQAALQDRDLDGNGVTDAFYDTDLDITWLRDANANGLMQWNVAVSWAANLGFAGFADWRLPQAEFVCHPVFGCTGSSEMGHLRAVELGNPPGGSMSNAGDFVNLQLALYWSGTDFPSVSPTAWALDMRDGGEGTVPLDAALYAMAVRDGDVPAIPEPGTYALMLVGLAGLTLWRRPVAPG